MKTVLLSLGDNALQETRLQPSKNQYQTSIAQQSLYSPVWQGCCKASKKTTINYIKNWIPHRYTSEKPNKTTSETIKKEKRKTQLPISSKYKLGTQFVKLSKSNNGKILFDPRPGGQQRFQQLQSHQGKLQYQIVTKLITETVTYRSFTNICSARLTTFKTRGFPSCQSDHSHFFSHYEKHILFPFGRTSKI